MNLGSEQYEKDSDMSTANQTEGQIPFDKMNAEDWCMLLCEKPQFADRCPWKKLDERYWGKLLCRQPQFAMNKPFRGEKGRNGGRKTKINGKE